MVTCPLTGCLYIVDLIVRSIRLTLDNFRCPEEGSLKKRVEKLLNQVCPTGDGVSQSLLAPSLSRGQVAN